MLFAPKLERLGHLQTWAGLLSGLQVHQPWGRELEQPSDVQTYLSVWEVLCKCKCILASPSHE